MPGIQCRLNTVSKGYWVSSLIDGKQVNLLQHQTETTEWLVYPDFSLPLEFNVSEFFLKQMDEDRGHHCSKNHENHQ